MPFVEGESLRDRLTREKQLPIADAVRIASEVAGALDYAHRHGVIHRDIKPENILLHDGSALVADFGIALAVASAGGTRMTETGMSLGTPQYMSPEQAMGEREIDARTRRLCARLRDLRDARRRAAVHRADGAGDRREGDDGGAASLRRCARRVPDACRGRGAHGARRSFRPIASPRRRSSRRRSRERAWIVGRSQVHRGAPSRARAHHRGPPAFAIP